jgi:hypothetical protein
MRRYSFADVIVLINGVEITGWADGDDVITVEQGADSASSVIGAAGEMFATLSTDRSATFSFTLKQTSPSNKFLLQLHDRMQGGNKTFVPVNIKFQDMYRQDMGIGSAGYIVRRPNQVRGANAQSNNQWQIRVENYQLVLGNPAPDGVAIGTTPL